MTERGSFSIPTSAAVLYSVGRLAGAGIFFVLPCPCAPQLSLVLACTLKLSLPLSPFFFSRAFFSRLRCTLSFVVDVVVVVVCRGVGGVEQRMPKGELIDVDSPFKMPDADKRSGTQEPFVRLEMLTPQVCCLF